MGHIFWNERFKLIESGESVDVLAIGDLDDKVLLPDCSVAGDGAGLTRLPRHRAPSLPLSIVSPSH